MKNQETRKEATPPRSIEEHPQFKIVGQLLGMEWEIDSLLSALSRLRISVDIDINPLSVALDVLGIPTDKHNVRDAIFADWWELKGHPKQQLEVLEQWWLEEGQ